jgi:hypothetical protein
VTDQPTLLQFVSEALTDGRVRFALVGAAALAVHGVSRSTQDIDLLVDDRRVLASDFWTSLWPAVAVDIRCGDADDPLAGVVRCRASGQRDVDIIVSRGAWEGDVITRARPAAYGGAELPVVEVADLVLLKLFAGGSQDRWDVEQLLARPDRDALVSQVEDRLAQLPARSRRTWEAWRQSPHA